MKTKWKTKLLFGFAALASLVPLFGFTPKAHADTISASTQQASSTTDAQGTTGNAAESIVCAKIDASTTELNQLISGSEAEYSDTRNAQAQTLAESRAESDQELAAARQAADATYAAQYASLMAQATTKAQKKAVVAFETTVNQAISDRRATVDAAIKEYRDGVDQIIATRSDTYNAALNTLETSIDTELAAKKASCLSNPPLAPFLATISTNIDLSGPQSQFQSTLASLSNTSDQLDTLASTRDDAVNQAETDFQASVQAAGATLKTALGEE